VDVWERIDALIAQGIGWKLTLHESQEIKLPRRNLRRVERQFRLRRFVTVVSGKRQKGGARPRCWLHGCSRCLRKHQMLACSPECQEKLLAWAYTVVGLLELGLAERLDTFDPDHDSAYVRRVVQQAHALVQAKEEGDGHFSTERHGGVCVATAAAG